MDAMERNEKGYSRFQWFIFVVLIPMFFTVTLVLVLLTVAGVNVYDYAKELPFISKVVTKETTGSEEAEILEVRLSEYESAIEKRDSTIFQLEGDMVAKEQEVDSLNDTIVDLQREISDLQAEQIEKKKTLDEVTKLYETMSAKSVASIVTNLKNDEAVKILSTLSTEKLAAILEKMNPEDAANYTTLLTN